MWPRSNAVFWNAIYNIYNKIYVIQYSTFLFFYSLGCYNNANTYGISVQNYYTSHSQCADGPNLSVNFLLILPNYVNLLCINL